MPPDNRTIADPTLLVDSQDSFKGRAVLLVYGSPGTDEHSKLLELTDGVQLLFGRSRKCTVHIDSEAVSRNHTRLSRTGDRFTVEDLGSRNGTKINGETISEPRMLRSGDEIGIGPVTAVLSISSAAAKQSRLGTISYLHERLVAECDRSHRYGRPLALIMMRLSGELQAVDEAVALLARRMRAMDSLCEYSPNELCVLMPELERSSAEQMAARMAREAQGILGIGGDAVQVGIALSPEHGVNPEELISAARAGVAVARKGGHSIATASSRESSHALVVVDPQMKRVFDLVQRVAVSAITVLILGETGTGKELVASALHRGSARKDRPYLRLNCASLPETLLESELFGHEKGAFTGAEQLKLGYFEAASGGTLFLDEIGEISAGMQAKLLRVLESRTFIRVGGTKEITVDVRFVCATHRNLEAAVTEGRFRQDLYYRISAFAIVVPALRDRRADIIPLAEHFLRYSSAEEGHQDGRGAPVLSAAARALLERYDWPGNVRQLRNAMERAVVLASEDVVEIEDLPDNLRDAPRHTQDTMQLGDGLEIRDQLADMEQAAIQAALQAVDGNQTQAAKALGLSRRALIYKMEKYGLKKPPASRQ